MCFSSGLSVSCRDPRTTEPAQNIRGYGEKFQPEIQNKDSEILQSEQMIEEANQKRAKLEKNLKLRGLSTEESEGSGDENGFYSVDLTPELFTSA
jgi:hypothetical protein